MFVHAKAENSSSYQELYEESVRKEILLEVQLNELINVPAAFKEVMDIQVLISTHYHHCHAITYILSFQVQALDVYQK